MKGTEGDAHAEANDPKLMRTRNLPGEPRTCPSCRKWSTHQADCPEMTIAAALKREQAAKQSEKWARERAAHWLNECRKMHGKLAILKAENRKLRTKLKP